MIASDQPTIFNGEIIAAVSSKKDGNLKFGIGDDYRVVENRQAFLKQVGIDSMHATPVGIIYATDDFAKYRVVSEDDKQEGMVHKNERFADALLISQSNHALFLPLADCVGAVLYDSASKLLMVSHLGRHSVEVEGAVKSVEYMKRHGATPETVKVWLSPAVGKATYPLHVFNGQSLHEVIVGQLLQSGIKQGNIEVSNVDTAHDENYYSHSQFLKGNEADAGRFAIVAMMK